MEISAIAETIKSPNKSLFFKSADPLDIRLGTMVSGDLTDYNQSKIVLLSCGQDQGVRRNNGRPGAANAPETIRKSLYRLASPPGLEANQLVDLGDSSIGADLEAIHEVHFSVVEQLLKDGKIVVVIGGGNDISYPDVKAVQTVFNNSLTINLDTHLDIRRNVVRNSGTPYRQLIDERIIHPRSFYEIGYQSHANAASYLSDAREMGIHLIPLSELQTHSSDSFVPQPVLAIQSQSLFLGFDMDVVKASDAPGVSAPSPTGLTAEQALQLVDHLVDKNTVRLFEITEVNPELDIDHRTAKLAAILIYRVIELMIGKDRS